MLDLLQAPDHCDLAVAQFWSRTLDEGTYLCSQSTMHRLLRTNGESGERRRQRTHPAKKKPELMAARSNEVRTWDISKLKGPDKGCYYDLYVIIDIFSRCVVGWLVAPYESAELATDFIHDAVLTQGVERDTLTIHADRGSSMRSKPVSQLLVDLGIIRSHSRPHVSSDNPFSEAAFKTSSTARRSPTGSAPSRTPGPSAPSSSSTTTTSAATRASHCTPQRRFTTARPPRSGTSARRHWPLPTPPIQSGSGTGRPVHPCCRRWRGSIHRRQRRWQGSTNEEVSQIA